MPRPYTLAIVDDDRAFLLRMTAAVRDQDPMAQVVAFENVDDFLRLVDTLEPCILLLDLVLDRRSGLSLLAQLRRTHPRVAVVMMSTHRADEPRYVAQRLGAASFETKPTGDDIAEFAASVTRLSSRLEQPDDDGP